MIYLCNKTLIFVSETIQLFRTIFKGPLNAMKFHHNRFWHRPSPEIVLSENIPENFVKTTETFEETNNLSQIQKEQKIGSCDEPVHQRRNTWFAATSKRKAVAVTNDFKASASITVIPQEQPSVLHVSMPMSHSMSY